MEQYLQPNWPAPANVKAYTTLRTSWGDPADNDNKAKGNQSAASLETLLDLPAPPIWVKQKHTAIVLEATSENKNKIADATFTNQLQHICAVLTADCLPVLICNKQGTHVAAVHAGWRGLASGILEATLQALRQPVNELLIWLGPAIGPQKFEVGKDVYDAFTEKHRESYAGFTPYSEGKWLANLYLLANIRLQLLGISQVYGGNFCTHSQNDLFFSYRRDKGNTGRMASLIWLDHN